MNPLIANAIALTMEIVRAHFAQTGQILTDAEVTLLMQNELARGQGLIADRLRELNGTAPMPPTPPTP